MQENQILNIEEAKNKFKEINEKFEKIISTTPQYRIDSVYGEAFGNLFNDAINGDLASQDYLGYIFKRGRKNLVPENIELSMAWQVLAAANGNQYTVERLAIFLNSSYDKILNLDDFEYMAYAFKITNQNYQYVLGKLICEAICDELGINENNIITEVPDTLLYNSSTMYKFNNAKDKAVQVVIDYMRKSYLDLKKFSHLKNQKQNEILNNDITQNKQEKKSFWNTIFNKK